MTKARAPCVCSWRGSGFRRAGSGALPQGHGQNAFLHQQTLNVSGSRDYQAPSARGVGTLGLFDRGHLSADWYYTSSATAAVAATTTSSSTSITAMTWAKRITCRPGMDRRLSSPGGTFSFSMLPLDRFQGARVGTTGLRGYRRRRAGHAATVLLARDARVVFRWRAAALQTFYLQAHINQIDTRNFPSGNYLVHAHL